MIQEYAERHEKTFAEAVQAIKEDMDNGRDFENSVAHYAELFEIRPDALRHEWNLRNADCR